MAMEDFFFMFAENQLLFGGVADQVSTNVYDAGGTGPNPGAIMLFGGSETLKIQVTVSAVGGTTPNIRARLVGADTADMLTNPLILDDTAASGTLVAAGLPIIKQLTPSNQRVAKRYYGVIWNQTGNVDNTATVSANGVLAPQNAGLI